MNSIIDLACGNWYTQILCTICKLGIPDLLLDGPQNVSFLAESTGTNEEALYRLLRGISCKGVFVRDGREFSNSQSSLILTTTHPSCMRAYCIMRGSEYQYGSWANLLYSLKTGNSALKDKFGMSMFEYLATHPDERKFFDEAMASITKQVAKNICDNHSHLIDGVNSIVDIGGGKGQLLHGLIGNRDNIQCTVLDLSEVSDRIEDPRISHIHGSFFDTIKVEADVYILKYILHDWGDDKCINILKNVRDVMVASRILDRNSGEYMRNPKLYIIESLLPDESDGEDTWKKTYHKLLDLHMMVCLDDGAQERTRSQYEQLLSQSNLKLTSVIPLQVLNLYILVVEIA